MRRAVAYVRVSTIDQAREGVSLDAQVARVEAYCSLHRMELVEVVREEGVSGTIPFQRRPGGQRVLRLTQEGVREVVALKLDRLFRNAVDALTQTKEWDRRDVALHLIDMGGQSIDTRSAVGRMFLTMMAGFGQFERDLISERTASALQHKKARLNVYNHTPLGFDWVADRLVANPDEQDLVGWIRAQHGVGTSMRAIAADLNSRGVTGKRGGRFYAATIRDVLKSTLYPAP